MLTVEVKINGRLIAEAEASNVTDLSDVSDYRVAITESPSKVAEHNGLYRYCKIVGHNRRQTAWALVEKIARAAQEDGDV